MTARVYLALGIVGLAIVTAIVRTGAPTASRAAPPGAVWIPPGEFWMGSMDPHRTDAHPVHRVAIRGFWLGATEVTNAQFAEFVRATGYVTVAERVPRAADYPGVPPGPARRRPAGPSDQLRSRRTRRRQARPAWRILPLHRPVLRALHA